jgi:hypothetical protein
MYGGQLGSPVGTFLWTSSWNFCFSGSVVRSFVGWQDECSFLDLLPGGIPNGDDLINDLKQMLYLGDTELKSPPCFCYVNYDKGEGTAK